MDQRGCWQNNETFLLVWNYLLVLRFIFFLPSYLCPFFLLFLTFRWRLFVLFILFSFFLFFVYCFSFVLLFRCLNFLGWVSYFLSFYSFILPLSSCDCLLFPFLTTLHLFVPLYLISAFIISLIQNLINYVRSVGWILDENQLLWITCVFAGNYYDFKSRDSTLASFWNPSFLCLKPLCPNLLSHKFST